MIYPGREGGHMSATGFVDELEQEDLEVTPDEARKALADTDLFLGDAFKIERMGVIRPGIRAPKKDCPPDLVALYNRLVEEGKTWDEIDEKLGLDPQKNSWLTPRNVDFFQVGRGDCHAEPSHAELIRKLYADRDGKIRKINIRFPFDDINKMIAVKLSCATGGLRFFGTFRDGRLMCENMLATASQPGKKKPAQVFSRTRVLKPCVPDQCDFYRQAACRMYGGFIFNITGVPGLGVWAIYTRSAHHSMVYIRTMLQKIKDLAKDYCGLSGIPGGLFYLKKIKGRVSWDGKRQYLITIGTDYDVDQLERILAEKHSRRNGAIHSIAAPKLKGRAIHRAAVSGNVDRTTGEIRDAGADAGLSGEPLGPSSAGVSSDVSGAAGSRTDAPAKKEPPKPEAKPPQTQGKAAASQAGSQSANEGNGSGNYDARLISFMKNELVKHPLLTGVDKASILKGVDKVSVEILRKPAKKASGTEVDRLIGTVKARLEKKDKGAFTQVAGNGGASSAPNPKPSQGPPTTSTDPLSGEWPEGAVASAGAQSAPEFPKQKASTPSPRQATADPLSGLSVQIAPFLRGVMKNPLFAPVRENFRQVMDAYSLRALGKDLEKLSSEEIGKFMTAVSAALAKKDVAAIIGNGQGSTAAVK